MKAQFWNDVPCLEIAEKYPLTPRCMHDFHCPIWDKIRTLTLPKHCLDVGNFSVAM